MPRVKKEKKLKMQDIKKNPDIEKKHFINKFVEHEREIMLLTTAIFMVLLFSIFVAVWKRLCYSSSVKLPAGHFPAKRPAGVSSSTDRQCELSRRGKERC